MNDYVIVIDLNPYIPDVINWQDRLSHNVDIDSLLRTCCDSFAAEENRPGDGKLYIDNCVFGTSELNITDLKTAEEYVILITYISNLICTLTSRVLNGVYPGGIREVIYNNINKAAYVVYGKEGVH